MPQQEDNVDFYTTMNCTNHYQHSTLPKPVDPISQISTREINKVHDIDGAQPKNKRILIKPDFNDNRDIEGSTSKTLHRSVNYRDNTLYVDDIDGARHFIKDRMLTTKRHTDPINPVYNLPTYEKPIAYSPKFVNDSFNVDDIDGAKPKTPKKFEPRESFRNDIVGAQANWRPRHEKARLEADPHDIMNKYSDISNRKLKPYEVSQRRTDLCAPVYNIYGMEIKDDPRYSKSKPLKKYIPQGTYSLTTHDIAGATSKFAPQNVRSRREIRNITTTEDIEGAQADTLKHSMQTKRVTNPLNPVYQSLDKGAPLFNVIEPLLPAEIVKKPMIKAGIEDNDDTYFGSTTLTQEAKSEAKNMDDLGWGPAKTENGVGENEDGMYLINPPAENVSKPPLHGMQQLNIPKPETNNDTPKMSFRSNPNSQRNSAPTSQRLNYVDRVSGGGSGRSQPSAIKSPKVYSPQVLSSRSVKTISGRLTSSDRKAISARNEEIDMVKNLQ